MKLTVAILLVGAVGAVRSAVALEPLAYAIVC